MNRNTDKSTIATLWINRGMAALIGSLLFFEPALLRWYCSFRYLSVEEIYSITGAFYACAVVSLYALWHLDRMLCSILKYEVFTTQNVNRIRRVRWCCALVSLFCAPAAWYYPPLWCLVVIMAFLCIMVNAVCQVMKAAVTIREENELTI